MPRLQTERLIMRPFCLYDAKEYKGLTSDPAILDTTDFPYTFDGNGVEDWIIHHSEAWNLNRELFLLATSKETREIVGSVSLFIYDRHNKSDIGYWVAKKNWNQGYATEAASVVIRYAFDHLNLHKLEANHLARNPHSGRVLEKLGFTPEGMQREGYLKDGKYEDLKLYGFLKTEYLALKEAEHSLYKD